LKLLESDRARLQTEMENVKSTRLEAESLLAKARVAAARNRQDSAGASQADARKLQAAADAADAQAVNATKRLNDALEAQQKIRSEQQVNQQELARTYDQQNELHRQLQKELDEWLQEAERVQSSTAGREWLTNQNVQSHRIKQKADQARLDAQAHDASLLAELEAQFNTPD